MIRGAWLLLLLPSAAFAWEHAGAVWAPEDQPFDYEISMTPVPTLGAGVAAQEIARAFTSWTDHDCLTIQTPLGTSTDDNTGVKADGRTVFSFEDPFDQVPGGALALTVLETTTTIVRTQEGVSYRQLVEADVVFADQARFAVESDVESEGCTDRVSFRSVALRETGHVIGLATPCDRGGPCADPDEAEATMHWLVSPCDTLRSTLAPDDLRGLAALYGPYVPFTCTPETEIDGRARAFGMVPFDLACEIPADHRADVAEVTWSFGEGATRDGLTASHTYAEVGNYDVSACLSAPELAECALFDACPTRRAYVVACDLPVPLLGWDEVEDATIQLVNDTPIPAEGCFTSLQWVFYDGANVRIDTSTEWEPRITFPGPGDYRAVLTLSGPAGSIVGETFPTVRGALDDTGEPLPPIGCGCASAPGLRGGLVLWILVGLTRRRPTCAARPVG